MKQQTMVMATAYWPIGVIASDEHAECANKARLTYAERESSRIGAWLLAWQKRDASGTDVEAGSM